MNPVFPYLYERVVKKWFWLGSRRNCFYRIIMRKSASGREGKVTLEIINAKTWFDKEAFVQLFHFYYIKLPSFRSFTTLKEQLFSLWISMNNHFLQIEAIGYIIYLLFWVLNKLYNLCLLNLHSSVDVCGKFAELNINGQSIEIFSVFLE